MVLLCIVELLNALPLFCCYLCGHLYLCIYLKRSLRLMCNFLFFFFIDKLVNDTPKMTSSASQPDLLGGWDSWDAGKTASASAAMNKSSYTNTGDLRNIYIAIGAWIMCKCCPMSKSKRSPEGSDSDTSVPLACGAPSMSKAKSQTFDPFADLGNLGSNLPGKVPVCSDLFRKLWSPHVVCMSSCLCSFLWDLFQCKGSFFKASSPALAVWKTYYSPKQTLAAWVRIWLHSQTIQRASACKHTAPQTQLQPKLFFCHWWQRGERDSWSRFW